ncbi:MAG: sulfurtransferase [Kordiimonadaceae bacterium]|nr:sulfurtransferase [Kordiimonadaceae bacterium]
MQNSPIISTDWLAAKVAATPPENTQEDRIIPLDASWHMPATGRSGPAEFNEGLIPGSVFFDIDQIADTSSNLPHTMPSAEVFSAKVSALGIKNTDTLVVYEKGDIPTAARVWWMFRAMGHKKAFVLDGGFTKWQSEGHPTTTALTEREQTNYRASLDNSLFRTVDTVQKNIDSKTEQLLDARAPGRFSGSEAEPRPGLRSGHIPGSKNLPFGSLYENGALKNKAELQEVISTLGLDVAAPITTTCGSGVTACNLALAFAVLGKWDVAVYDGSWTEWGSNPKLPIEV